MRILSLRIKVTSRRRLFYINNEPDESAGFNAEGGRGGGLYLIVENL